jgi:hypothetical protein
MPGYPYTPLAPACITVAARLPRDDVHDPCTVNVMNQYGLDDWAKYKLNQPRYNIDGVPLPNRPCDYMCDKQNNQQFVGMLGQPRHNYRLAGGLLIAPQFFKNCLN